MSTGDNIYTLQELVTGDFKMSAQDKDFELSHEMLIKAVKILLYRFNLYQKKNMFERQELATMIGERISKVEEMTMRSLEEVNTFLHTIHSDFEGFLQKHRKEHLGLSMKLVKVTEDITQLVESIRSTRTTVDTHSTVMACLVEFSAIA